MAETDLELWQNILAGDAKAWAELVRRYQALVYTVATRAGLSMDDASDCFQQTWVALYQNRKKLQNPSRLSAWLVTTAKREALRLRRLTAYTADTVGRKDLIDTDLPPDEELVRIERQAQLEVALHELNPQCRKVMELFFYAPESRTYSEIAESLGVAANSLGPIRRRCLERLRKILIKNGYQ